MNDRKIKLEAYFMTVGNRNQFGNNFTIAPRASLIDGLLDMVILTPKQTERSVANLHAGKGI